jgi:hypothetical protein
MLSNDKARTNRSTSSVVWDADKVMRSLAVFTGTVGARIALIQTPCAIKSAEAFNTAWLLPITNG